jgi:hypothetical protein
VLLIAGVWIAFLAGLAWWTANPVTLNVAALRQARENGAVIVGEVVPNPSGADGSRSLEKQAGYSVRVMDVLAAGAEGNERRAIEPDSVVDVVDVNRPSPTGGSRLLLILGREPSSLRLRVVGRSYPATAELVRQAHEMLSADR